MMKHTKITTASASVAAAGVPFLFKQWGGTTMKEIKAAGRALDGVIHDGYPVM